MRKKDLRGIEDLSREDAEAIFDLTGALKAEVKRGEFRPLLAGRTLAMIFEKPSLRTRVTFDAGMFQLGGHAIYVGPGEVGLGHRESPTDVARNLGRWVDIVVARTFKQDTIDELAQRCWKPVINALSDREHPCQAMADFFTLQEQIGAFKDVCLGYVGDGNNVAHSLMLLGALVGAEVRVATPPGFEPDPQILARAQALHPCGSKGIVVWNDPQKALSGCNAVYTDVWASMGQEEETERRAMVFAPYQLNAALLACAERGAKIMHCLPAHRGVEITDEVIDSPDSVVYEQAENRLHVQKAIMVRLFEDFVV